MSERSRHCGKKGDQMNLNQANIEALQVELAKLRDQHRWRDIRGGFPPTLEPVLVFGSINGWVSVHEGFWTGRYWSSIRYNVDDAEKITDVKFWRPMPEPPEAIK